MYTAYHIGNSDAVEALLTAGAQGRNEAAQSARDRGLNEIAELIENWGTLVKSASQGAVASQEITPQAAALDEQQQDFSALEKMLNASDKEYDANAAFAIARKYVPFPGLEIEGISPTAQKRLQQLKRRASRASRGHGD